MDSKKNNMPVAAAIGAAGSLLGGIFSSSQSVKNQKMAIEAQRQENEKNRTFNAEQAKLARQYNTDMWNAQNDYNDPSAVQHRLSKAGIHPALAYTSGQTMGSISMGNTGAQASSSGGISTPLADFSGIRDAANNAASAFGDLVESRNIESQTKLNEIEATYKGELGREQILNLRGNTGVAAKVANLTEEQTNKVVQESANLREENVLIKNKAIEAASNAALADERAYAQWIENQFGESRLNYKDLLAKTEVRKMLADADISEKQAETYLEFRRAEINLMCWQAYASRQQGNYSGELAKAEEMYNKAAIKVGNTFVNRAGVSLLRDYNTAYNQGAEGKKSYFYIDNFWDAKKFDGLCQLSNGLFGMVGDMTDFVESKKNQGKSVTIRRDANGNVVSSSETRSSSFGASSGNRKRGKGFWRRK